MSTPPRHSNSGDGSRYRDSHKQSRRHSYERHHHSASSHQDNHPSRSNSDSYSFQQPHVNMYVQRRDYYHPTFNQYGSASNNYIRDTNIHIPHPPYHDRGRGYGEEYNIPPRNANYYDGNDHNGNYPNCNDYSSRHRSYNFDDPRGDRERQDTYHPSSKSTTQPATDGWDGPSSDQPNPRSSHKVSDNQRHALSGEETSSQLNNNNEANDVTLSTEQTSVSDVPAIVSAQNNTSPNNSKKKRKRTMSERRKQMHRERARLHQEGLKKKKALEQLASSPVNVTTTDTTDVDVAAPIGPTSILSEEARSTRTIVQRNKIQKIEDRQLVAALTTGLEDNSVTSLPKKKTCWTNCRLMQKFKSRAFSSKVQQVMDTKYKYYNPFAKLKKEEEYGGFKTMKKSPYHIEPCKEIGTYNESYSDLFEYWKPAFVSSLRDKMPGYRMLWLTSYTLHVVAVKIFSMITEDITDFMHVIGQCLVGDNIYTLRSDVENKAQYENERMPRETNCIHQLKTTFTYKIESFFFPEYRYASGLIAECYSRRARDLTSGFLLSSSEFAHFCLANRTGSESRCFYGNEPSLFRFRKEALQQTFDYIDKTVNEYPFEVEIDETNFSDEDSFASNSHWFEGGDEKPRGMHRDKLKEMLFLLQFSGFECALKCPCSKVYGDLIFLYGCPLAEDQCKNQTFHSVSALLDHFSSKFCVFHTVLSKYLSSLCEVSGLASIPQKKESKFSRNENDSTVTTIVCDICQSEVPPNDVLKKASEQVNRTVQFIQSNQAIICPICVSAFLQRNRINESEEKLLSIYMNTLKMHKYYWSGNNLEVNALSYVKEHMCLEKYNCEEAYFHLKKNIDFKEINVMEIVKDYKESANSILGVGLPTNALISSLKPNLIQCPHKEFGLIHLPRKNDFIIIVKSHFDELSVLEQSLNEMKEISSRKTAGRAGAAGGIMVPTSRCRSLSKVTKNDRVLCVRPRSTGLSLTYRNSQGIVKSRNSVYSDLLMTRLSAKKKFQIMINSVALQRVSVKEMISRLRAFILLDYRNILPIEESLKGYNNITTERVEMEKKFREKGRTPMESKLLSWACSTGEMRNHQAVKTHFDGNKSHPVETMSLFGRIPVNSKKLTVEYVKSMECGYLLLPLEGVTIKIQCGYDLIHCSLKSTLHLADNSRNTCNWSRVHGP